MKKPELWYKKSQLPFLLFILWWKQKQKWIVRCKLSNVRKKSELQETQNCTKKTSRNAFFLSELQVYIS